MQIKNVRFIIAAITTFSAYAVYVSRVNLSIAIIAMVEDGHQHQQASASAQTGGGGGGNGQPQVTQLANATSISSGSGGGGGGGGPPLGFNGTSTQLPNLLLPNSTLPTTPTPPVFSRMDGQSQQQQHHETFAGTFPTTKKSILKPPLISQEKFHWDQTEQGHILGAFFYGYILFQIPGARMAESVGARWIVMAATAGSAIISLVFPLSTQLNSIHLLMVLRFVMGLCQSAFFPAAYVFFCRWLPENERSVLLPIMFIGSNMGSISTYIMSSYLISSSYGWPSVFYVSGLICLFVTLLWFVFGSNGPQDNWLITREECDYITKNLTTNGASGSNNNNNNNVTSTQPLVRQYYNNHHHHPNCPKLDQNNNNKMIQQLALSPTSLANNKNCDKTTTTTSSSSSRVLMMNKSKSANDLIPATIQAQLTYHPQVIVLDPQSGRKTTAPLARDLNNNNNNFVCCQHSLLPQGVGASSTGPITIHEADGTTTTTATATAAAKQLSWCKLLGSLPIWVLILSMYGNEWSQVVLTYELPTYLNTALSFPIEQNGVINSFFQLSYTVASPILSSLGAYLLERRLLGMRKIHVRKLFQSLATFGQMACFVSVPICGANRGLIIMFMFSATVFKACANAGDIMVPGDLSPEYAGTIFAFANSMGNTAGFVVPLLAGYIVNNPYERERWTPFWMTTATIMGCSGLIFLVLGETRRQNFSIDDNDDNDKNDNESHNHNHCDALEEGATTRATSGHLRQSASQRS